MKIRLPFAILAALAAASPALAAQQDITQITGATASREALRTQVNTRLQAVHSNFDELYAADLLKANISCFADAVSFNACFALDWPTGFDVSGNYTVTGTWDFTGATVTGVGGSDYTLPTATDTILGGVKIGNRLTITDGVLSADVQSVGSADSLTAQYIDWNASSGGPSIANKPPIGTAAALDHGTDAGDLVRLVDDAGTPALPFTLSYTDLTDKPTIPADVGDLTDTGGLLGGTGLPEGGTVNQIIVKTAEGYAWIDLEDHPQFASLLTAFDAAGLNSFTFTISSLGTDTLSGGTYYQNSVPFPVAVAVTDTSTSYDIAGVEWKLNAGSYASMSWNGTSSVWEATGLTGSDGAHTLQFRATDNKSTPNTGESQVINIVIDTTAPVVDLTP